MFRRFFGEQFLVKGGGNMEQTGIVSIDFLSILVWLISIIIFIAIVWAVLRFHRKRIMRDVEKLVDKKINERFNNILK